jgi:hypothetical protein
MYVVQKVLATALHSISSDIVVQINKLEWKWEHLRLRSTEHIGLIVLPHATALTHYDNVCATYKKEEGITFSITYYLASHHHDRR